MDDFDVHAARLSAEADDRLGDLIQYAVDGANGGDFVDMKGRVLAIEPMVAGQLGWRQGDEVQGGYRLRIAMEKVPAPSRDDRLKCARVLGDQVYRPNGKNPLRDGRYWLVDLQKV